MPGLTGTESNIYPRCLTVSQCHLPVITSIEEMLTTRLISDHEKVGGIGEGEGETKLEYFRL